MAHGRHCCRFVASRCSRRWCPIRLDVGRVATARRDDREVDRSNSSPSSHRFEVEGQLNGPANTVGRQKMDVTRSIYWNVQLFGRSIDRSHPMMLERQITLDHRLVFHHYQRRVCNQSLNYLGWNQAYASRIHLPELAVGTIPPRRSQAALPKTRLRRFQLLPCEPSSLRAR